MNAARTQSTSFRPQVYRTSTSSTTLGTKLSGTSQWALSSWGGEADFLRWRQSPTIGTSPISQSRVSGILTMQLLSSSSGGGRMGGRATQREDSCSLLYWVWPVTLNIFEELPVGWEQRGTGSYQPLMQHGQRSLQRGTTNCDLLQPHILNGEETDFRIALAALSESVRLR